MGMDISRQKILHDEIDWHGHRVVGMPHGKKPIHEKYGVLSV